jgi:hypothetical protein
MLTDMLHQQRDLADVSNILRSPETSMGNRDKQRKEPKKPKQPKKPTPATIAR